SEAGVARDVDRGEARRMAGGSRTASRSAMTAPARTASKTTTSGSASASPAMPISATSAEVRGVGLRCSPGDGNSGEGGLDSVGGRVALELRLRPQDEPVAQDRPRDVHDVVGRHVVAAGQAGEPACG